MNKQGYLTNKEYNNIYSKSPRICVDLIIKNQDNVLLIKRTEEPYKGKWHMPGGRIRFRETIEDTIDRIFINETDIGKIDSINFFNYIELLKETQNKQKRHSISIVFKCEVSHFDSIKGKWFNKNNLPKNIISEHKNIINKL